MKKKKLISFVIPVYNEEAVIPYLINKISYFIDTHSKYLFEVIFIENGSKDSSFMLLKHNAKKK